MIETRTLIRDVIRMAPDGTAIRRSELIEVELRCPNGLDERRAAEFAIFGEWRLLPKTEGKT